MIRKSRHQVGGALSFLLAAAILAGCGQEDPVQVGSGAIVEPVTADQLVSHFAAAYQNRDVQAYLGLLDQDYQTLLQSVTTAEFPGLGPSLDIAEEERIHVRMWKIPGAGRKPVS